MVFSYTLMSSSYCPGYDVLLHITHLYCNVQFHETANALPFLMIVDSF